ncbi:hypothetical protein GP486_002103 [Trichoglossum hirsutum]|uniref:Uncharacterized protein n=1 Tax=Trichoglossum hirsutum TaxID=265104 RepID=A0A9P8LFK1_9PEZI|nr:hypothetical protein GP486_002103 [Trichoglossum hirsutum]
MSILKSVLKNREEVVLAIQKETMVGGLELDDAAAGREISKERIKLEEQHRKEVRELEEDWQDAERRRDFGSAQQIAELRKQYEEKIAQSIRDRESLRITMEKLQDERVLQIKKIEEQKAQHDAEMRKREEELERMRKESWTQDRQHMVELHKHEIEIENLKIKQQWTDVELERKNRGMPMNLE